MNIVLTIALFFLILIVFELLYSLFKQPDGRSIGGAVERYSSNSMPEEEIDILYYRKFSDIKLLDTVLAAVPAVGKLDELMQQGGVKTLAGIYILLTLVVGAVLFLLCGLFKFSLLLSCIISVIGMLLPYFYLLYRRQQRRARFEVLFPDALDLMGYSLKAGHSILSSFKMVAEEIADPVGEEFDRVVEEINFGRDLNSCLRNFSRRIDSLELRFFVTSAIIQRETGGNLVEMLEKISEVIRKKFRFREKVKTMSAEGKLSAIILLALPILTGAAIFILNPDYLMILLNDPIGPYIIITAIVMMAVGSFIMYRLVQLDV